MNTEITKIKDCNATRGWVFYDGECPVCVGSVARFGGIFARRGFAWLPLQTPGTAARLGMSEAVLREEMKLLRADGRVAGGADALAALLRSVWWLWPMGCFLEMPGIHWLGCYSYRWIVRHRCWFSKMCKVRGHNSTHHRHAAFFEMP
ncbi:MAG: DUF393 domain-containing protein [Verrucomicrobia bacterium]|nr:DUF393 domain-containing protein [Verrucomicrobiota bacterium]